MGNMGIAYVHNGRRWLSFNGTVNCIELETVKYKSWNWLKY